MQARIGLLGLYLELYDRRSPGIRAEIDGFYARIAQALESMGLGVTRYPPCRLSAEFKSAVAVFEDQSCDAIVTLHLAYSPSLEAVDSLCATTLPLIVLDTTPDEGFGPAQSPARIMFNHGIHGVQDLCSLLVRRGRRFQVEAGHWKASDVLERVVTRARGIAAAGRFRSSRVGLIGEPFAGMGDFHVSEEELSRRYGIEVRRWQDSGGAAGEGPGTPTPERIALERDRCGTFMKLDGEAEPALSSNLRVALRLRDWIQEEGLRAFTFNFSSIGEGGAIDRVPFLAASLAMQEGIGYAGEGDVLTANFVAALLSLNPLTTFTEMFCPDWAGGRIFMSHMGEVNPRVCGGGARAMRQASAFVDASETIYVRGRLMEGDALLVNLVPMEGAPWRLIVCPVSVESGEGDAFKDSVRGWIKPRGDVAGFLESYSRLGGTHHSALVYGERVEALDAFGDALGFEVRVLGQA